MFVPHKNALKVFIYFLLGVSFTAFRTTLGGGTKIF